MARLQACLIDAYGTILDTDFAAHRDERAAMAGISAAAIDVEFSRVASAITVGQISMAGAFAHILRECDVEPRPDLVRDLVDKSRELLLASACLYEDVLPFLRTLRSRGIRTAIVSNCDENTRDLLVELGVAALTDALVLSCEVGAAKPAALIYARALDRLGVTADAALFVDDNPASCAGAAALGISAVQIVRGGADRRAAGGTTAVRSLTEVEALLRA